MDLPLLLKALILGVVEGLTEFLPVSSTGHLILVGDLLDFHDQKGKIFEIVIQTGAMFAIVWEYRAKFAGVIAGLTRDRDAQRFVANIAVAFLPAAILGLAFGSDIKAALCPEDDKATDDKSDRDRHRLEERRLDVAAEGETKYGRRQERDRDIGDEPLRIAVAGEPRDHARELRAVLPDDRKHCAGLDDDLEDLALLVIEIEQVANEYQVAGARHRQKFGQPLDHAEYQRLEQ